MTNQKYYYIHSSINESITGSLEWQMKSAQPLYQPPPSRKYRNDIAYIEPVIEHIPKAIEKRYIISFINFGPRFTKINCAKDIFLEKIGWDLSKKYLRIGRIFWENGDEVRGWKTYLKRSEYFIEDLSLMTGEPLYTSLKYRFILREDVFDRIKEFQFKDCEIGEIYPSGKSKKISQISSISTAHAPEQQEWTEYLDNLKVKNSNILGKLDEKEISSFEAKMRVKLPNQYREYLLKFNGGFPKEKVICPYLREDFYIYHFYGISKDAKPHEQSLRSLIHEWRSISDLPQKVIPIADDGSGDDICIGISKNVKGKIFFWRHETEELIKTFDSFFEMLKARELE